MRRPPDAAHHEQWNWTQRFVASSLLALLFAAVQLNWFGTLPGASSDLLTQAALLTLIGLFALRISPVGIAIALGVGYVAIFVDQATAGIGIAPLRFTPGAEFWVATLPRVCITWIAFPLLVWFSSRFAPAIAGGLVLGAALLVLPFIRYDPAPSLLSALLAPAPGRYLVLAVPWIQLCAVVSVIATVALLLARARPQLARVVATTLVVVTVALPLSARATREFQASVAIAVSPNSGGPLTEVTVRAAFEDARTPIVTWDNERVVLDGFLAPVRTGMTRHAELSFLPASIAASGPGPHQVRIRIGADVRLAIFHVVDPGGLVIAMENRTVVMRGGALQPLRVLVDGLDGRQLLDVALDASGSWRSPLALPSGSFRIFGQSGRAWSVIDVH